MNLVIVESPSKTKAIGKYLGSNYKVVSSKGHIRDLATSGKFGLGVDIEKDFEPNYIPITGKKKIINELKRDAKEADMVYLATDPDREGEAISWHLYDAIGLNDDNYKRILFNEITEGAVKDAIKNPKMIDYNLVKSQETRRILDRIIGFRLSKLMQSKTGGKSAGRVQSVALKLIVDREREIEAFIPEEYWTIEADFDLFKSELEKYNNKKLEIKSEEEANKILIELSDTFKVISVESKEKNKKGVMPFITSTLQQACSTKFNFGSSKTMSIAQKLYEGKDIGSETVGLISYMRTDSTRLSNVFVSDALSYIESEFGKEYVGNVKISKKTDNVQDAHEAIRPTSIKRTPESVKKYLTSDEFKVYSIIYYRALASLMKDAKVIQTSIVMDNNNYHFKTTGQVTSFDGFMKVYKDYMNSEDVTLPIIKEGDIFNTDKISSEQHFTKPASRYTEASLIKEMESLGIGRPSTYAKTMETLKERAYVNIIDKKFHPTEVGIETTDKLQEFFSNIINVEYTRDMETDLDEIALEKQDNIKVLRDFYDKFEPLVENAFSNMEKKAPVSTGEVCPNCGNELVIRKGRYGEFTACSNYPECKYIKQVEKEIKEICDCPVCNNGKIIEKKTKKNKIFYGCNNYPKCKTAAWDIPTGELCPECKNLLINKNNIIKCSNCEYEK
ncbi:MAG: type I DNA topoisomerase [Bacilli bacterium]|nr:type I DNA topoisomerase [Bacilli bacterium]